MALLKHNNVQGHFILEESFLFLIRDIPVFKNQGRQWRPTPVLLPGKSHGQRSLVGYSPWGCKKLDMTEQLSTHDNNNIYSSRILAMNLIRYMICKYFQSIGVAFSFHWSCSFEAYKLLILIQSKLSFFNFCCRCFWGHIQEAPTKPDVMKLSFYVIF